MSNNICKDTARDIAKGKARLEADQRAERRRHDPIVIPDPEPVMFTCVRCRRWLPEAEDSGERQTSITLNGSDKVCKGCAAIDPWEPHAFDGGAMGDIKCCHCRMSVVAPRHQ